MKETNCRTVFYNFYRITENGFYTKDEQKRVMKLLCVSNGLTENEAESMTDAVNDLRDDGVCDSVSCQNFLLISKFVTDIPLHHLCAALAFYDICDSQECNAIYFTKSSWCRAVIADPLRRAFFEYALGKEAEAVKSFEEALKKGTYCLPIHEILATVYNELGDERKALEYALCAQWIDEDTKIDLPHMALIEARTTQKVGIAEALSIKNKACAKKETTFRIGFSS